MRRAFRLLPACLAGCLVIAAPAAADPPGNDVHTAAAELRLGAAVSLNTNEATSSAGEPGTSSAPAGCARMGRTVWFRVRGNGHALRISTIGSDFDTVVSIYDTANTPIEANRMACNNNSGGSQSVATAASTVRGNTYLVQVGGFSIPDCNIGIDFCARVGSLTLSARGVPQPDYDDPGAPVALPTGVPTPADNVGATGETVACDGTRYAATIWFKWTAPDSGTPTFDASATPANPVMTVLRASDGAVIGCNDDAEPSGAARVALGAPVARGQELLIEVGSRGADDFQLQEGTFTLTAILAPIDLDLDDDGVAPPQDCDDTNPAVFPTAVDVPEDGSDQNCDGADAVILDRDRDGSNRPADCNDANPAIRPTTPEIRGNGVDEDCDFIAQPFLRITSAIRNRWLVFREFTRVDRLTVRDAPVGAVARVTCEGKGCPKKAKRLRSRGGKELRFAGFLAKRKLRPGAVVEVRITLSGRVGKVVRYKIRDRKQPVAIVRCLQPGARKTSACPRAPKP